MSNSHSKTNRIDVRRLIALAFVLALLSIALLPGRSFSSAAATSREKRNARTRMSGAKQYAPRATMMSPMFAAIDVDRTDDVAAAAACTAAPSDCSLRGAVTFANLNPGTTINVPAGTYNLTTSGAGEGFTGNNLIGDVDIKGNNTSIVGAGAATTIIHQTTAGDRVVEVNPDLLANFITSISGVTISGGTETTAVGGGGIISGSIGNSLTLSNCVISGNSATGAGTFGGGGVSHEGGNLTITNCTFSGNSTSGSGGGLGYSGGDPLIRQPSNGILTVSGSTFSNNTANSIAAGGGGADLFNFNGSNDLFNISSSSFSGNNAAGARGGAIVVESGTLALTTSSLSGNSAAVQGGGLYNSGTSVVTYSRLTGNSGTNGRQIFSVNTNITANDNWWGINTGPTAIDFANTAGGITPLTWLQLQASASPSSICSGSSSTISANIKKRNVGVDLTVELNGLPPFPASFINATPAFGNISGASPNFVDGAASATFNGTADGTANIDVTADNQTVTASVIVGGTTTSDPADQAVCQGGTATFTTTSSGTATFVWKKGATVLNNGDLGGRVTIVSGANSSSLSISNVQASDADTYTVEAQGECNTASQSATLVVNSATTTTDPADQSVCEGATVGFSTTAGGTGPFHYAWTLDSLPYNGDNSSITVNTAGMSPGDHTITVTTTGACGSASQSATLTIGSVTLTVGTSSISVWPPNHQYQTFTIGDFDVNATSCEGNITSSVVIKSVTSDELDNNPGGADGNTINDIVIAGDCKSVQLRRERDGDLDGRVYTITFSVTDAHGNTKTATAQVTVPLNQNGGGVVNSGPHNTVNGTCP